MVKEPLRLTLGFKETEPFDVIVERIHTIRASTKNAHVIVAIFGSDVSVGKSTVASTLEKMLSHENIAVASTIDVPGTDVHAEMMIKEGAEKPGVIIVRDLDDLSVSNKKKISIMRKTLNNRILEVTGFPKADLWIGVYRPDRPFSHKYTPADILIENTGARDR